MSIHLTIAYKIPDDGGDPQAEEEQMVAAIERIFGCKYISAGNGPNMPDGFTSWGFVFDCGERMPDTSRLIEIATRSCKFQLDEIVVEQDDETVWAGLGPRPPAFIDLGRDWWNDPIDSGFFFRRITAGL